jgi:hypothetical protein
MLIMSGVVLMTPRIKQGCATVISTRCGGARVLVSNDAALTVCYHNGVVHEQIVQL